MTFAIFSTSWLALPLGWSNNLLVIFFVDNDLQQRKQFDEERKKMVD
jgi:hypothetical protein